MRKIQSNTSMPTPNAAFDLYQGSMRLLDAAQAPPGLTAKDKKQALKAL